MTEPLRVMVYDKSCRGRGALPGLSHAWSAGAVLYKMLGRIDTWYGAGYWIDALDWLLDISAKRPIAEVQFWGHGEWGGLWIDEELLTITALEPGHPVHERLVALRSRLVPGGQALWWFRSCDVFGTQVGHDFARAWTRFFNCRAAGHTHQIMFFQSGLHVLAAGDEPSWPVDEGFVPGLPKARDSSLLAPSTVTCLHNRIPSP